MTVDKIVEGALDFTSIAVSLTNSFQVPLQLWMRSAAALLRDKLSKVRAQVRDLSHLVVVVESINHFLANLVVEDRQKQVPRQYPLDLPLKLHIHPQR